ncbi:hypothetical protein Tco_0629361 [Tanacetum coccineum]|uniref:Uncharacterized protein n=1 Tax=Tanacetum coccineum TaxID=301880 RepID=A0ABQ4WSZ1_9ASTR
MKKKPSKPTPSRKIHKGKRYDHLVGEADKEPQTVSEPQVEDDEYNLQRGIQMSLESFQAPVNRVAIHKPDSGIIRKLPEDDTSANVVCDTSSPADAKTGADMEKSTNEGQARSDPGKTPESRPLPKHVLMEEYQARSNHGQSHVVQAGPNPEPMHEDFVATVYPHVHEILKLATKEYVHIKNPPSSSVTLSSMKNLDDAFTFGDQFLNDKPSEEEPGKANVETEVESIFTIPIHQASSSVPPLSMICA